MPGSSNVFNVGYITYSNQFKNELLNVSSDILNHRGAVSSEVAIAMSEGCLNQSNASYALSITGIAGPNGGSIQKPVGLVYIGVKKGSKLNSGLGNRIRTTRANRKGIGNFSILSQTSYQLLLWIG